MPLGWLVAQMLECISPGPDEIVLPKTSSSVFQSTNLDYLLRSLGVRQLVLAGCVTGGRLGWVGGWGLGWGWGRVGWGRVGGGGGGGWVVKLLGGAGRGCPSPPAASAGCASEWPRTVAVRGC